MLTVIGNGVDTGTYSFALHAVADAQTFPVAIGDTVSDGVPTAGEGNIESVGAIDEYTFTIPSGGERVHLSASDDTCGCQWSLRSADGSLASGFAAQALGTVVAPTWLPAGTYALTVTGESTDTGTYSFSISSVPDAQTFAISVDGPAVSDGAPATGAGNIEAPGAMDEYTFTIPSGGERVFLSASDDTCGCQWSLRSADGSLASGFAAQALGTVVAPTWLPAGTYALTVTGESTDTGTYSFSISSVPDAQTFAISVDGPAVSDGTPATGAGNIEAPGAIDQYTFSASAGQEIAIVGSDCASNPSFVLSAPDGRQLVRDYLCNTSDVLELPNQTGQYTLEVGGDTTDLGTYSLEIESSGAPTTVSLPDAQVFPISVGDSVSDGTPAPGAGNIESAGNVDSYEFTGVAGQTIRFNDLGAIGCCSLYWQIYAPDGTIVGQDWFVGATYGASIALPESGSYEIDVSADGGTATGAYSFSITSAPDSQTFAISVDGPAVSDGQPATGAGNIESPGSDDEYAFTGTAGQTIRFNDLDLSPTNLYWQLYAPDGTILGQNWLGATEGQQLTLPESGQYTLRVNDYFDYYYGYYGYCGDYGYCDGTGTYSFSLTSVADPQTFAISVDGPAVSDGQPATGAGNIESPGSDDEYAFTGTAGQTIRVNDLDLSPTNLYWQLYAPDGTILGQNWLGNTPGSQLTLPTTGQYTIRVNDYYSWQNSADVAATGTYSFSLTSVPDAQVFPISLGDTVSDGQPSAGAGNIESPGSDDEYAFNATAGQTIQFNDLTSPCCSIYWQLYAPDGTVLGQSWFGDSAGVQFIASESGQYTIRANDYYSAYANAYGTATGTYSFSLKVVPLVVPTVTAPIATAITAGQNAVWTVAIRNMSAAPLTHVSATLHAAANGSTPLGFDQSAMPGCSAVTSSEVCSVADIAAGSTGFLSVFVPTDGLSSGTVVTGDIDVSADGVPDATGTLGAVTIASCGTECVLAVAAPGVAVSSIPGAPTSAHPTKQILTLPAAQTGQVLPAVPVTLQSITPSGTESASDQKLCPTGANQTHCSGQISGITAQFGKYNDAAHPIRVSVVARWGSTVPSGRILMEKNSGGDPLFLIKCVLDPTTHKYNTPCELSENTTGTKAAGNLTTTDIILFTGLDIHFARRVSTGATKITPPAVPTALAAVPGSAKATLTWKAPTLTHGAAVTSYIVTVIAAGKTVKTVTFASPALTGTVTGLTNGKSYTFKVAAENVAGTGPQTSTGVTIVVGAPAPPTSVRAVKTAAGSLKLTFTAPATNGAAVSGYTASCSSTNGGTAKTKAGTASPITVTGLSAGPDVHLHRQGDEQPRHRTALLRVTRGDGVAGNTAFAHSLRTQNARVGAMCRRSTVRCVAIVGRLRKRTRVHPSGVARRR